MSSSLTIALAVTLPSIFVVAVAAILIFHRRYQSKPDATPVLPTHTKSLSISSLASRASKSPAPLDHIVVVCPSSPLVSPLPSPSFVSRKIMDTELLDSLTPPTLPVSPNTLPVHRRDSLISILSSTTASSAAGRCMPALNTALSTSTSTSTSASSCAATSAASVLSAIDMAKPATATATATASPPASPDPSESTSAHSSRHSSLAFSPTDFSYGSSLSNWPESFSSAYLPGNLTPRPGKTANSSSDDMLVVTPLSPAVTRRPSHGDVDNTPLLTTMTMSSVAPNTASSHASVDAALAETIHRISLSQKLQQRQEKKAQQKQEQKRNRASGAENKAGAPPTGKRNLVRTLTASLSHR